MWKLRIVVIPCILFGAVTVHAAQTATLEAGAIPLNPTAASVAEQNNLISQLRAAGVHVIRVALTTDNVRIAFAKRAYEQGIKIEALIEPQFPKGQLPDQINRTILHESGVDCLWPPSIPLFPKLISRPCFRSLRQAVSF